MFERIEKLIGENKLSQIKEKNVCIIGLGGVGGYATEALIRSGIENIIIIDHDYIDISNLNRQIITNQNNIGNKKIDEMEKRINSINPNCNIIKIDSFITKDNLLNKGNIIAIKGYTKKIKKEVFIVPTNISILKKNNL